jgi:hypothetical protein
LAGNNTFEALRANDGLPSAAIGSSPLLNLSASPSLRIAKPPMLHQS